MAFFVRESSQGRSTYYNINRARSIAHDQTSIDRARWVFEFGFLTRRQIVVQQDTQTDDYNKITSYFLSNSSGV